MTKHQHTVNLVSEYFDKNPLPRNYNWVVYSTNAKTHGYCISRKLIVYHGPKPVNYVQAEKRGEIVCDLPLSPGKQSPTIEAVCDLARVEAR